MGYITRWKNNILNKIKTVSESIKWKLNLIVLVTFEDVLDSQSIFLITDIFREFFSSLQTN